MSSRRLLLVLFACGLLAACVQPLVPTEQAAGLQVRRVVVDMAGFQGVKGREITVSADKVRADVQAQLNAQLAPTAAGNADVLVAVNAVSLVSPGQSILIGGVSTIRGRVQVTEVGSGKVIVPATDVVGTAEGGWAPGGLIGALSTKSPEADYSNTVASFAADVKRRLFGTQGK